MGQWCWCCDKILANEKFSGRGHRPHICRKCVRMPEDKRSVIEQRREISGFLEQSHISEQNIKRLRVLAASSDPNIAWQAQAVLDVALFQPYKRRRLKNLARNRLELLRRLGEAGLIFWFENERDFGLDPEIEYCEDEVYDEDGTDWFVD